ncbi:hypothetical protein MKZ38_009115 [Zalerion maritima]|uniref:DUF7082 domain-containing protein n=1 Tax=Zalerion maritima TaxID=339359 RepID=A0AAD5RGM0_9PEZI|nr:hypothetical protein MKZ38_009115 [Zalerion maritima]
MSYADPKPPQMHGYQDAGYHPYPQSFTGASQHQGNTPAQINSMAVTTNSATSHNFMYPPPSVISYEPNSGLFGSKVVIKVSSQQDITLITPQPYFYVTFGSRRCDAQVQKEAQDQNGCIYSVYADAPPFMETGSQSASVPIALMIEGVSNIESPTVSIGQFYYHDPRTTGAEGPAEVVTGTKAAKSPESQASPSQQLKHDMASESTYTSGYPSAPSQHQPPPPPPPQPSSSYSTSGYSNNNPPPSTNNMIGAYRSTSSFNDPLIRTSSIRSPAWSPYPGGHLDATRSPGIGHTTIPRANPLTPLSGPAGAGGAPMLIRTSTIQNVSGSPGGSAYNPYALYPNKAHLKIQGDLDIMGEAWTPEEVENRRRIVLFKKTQSGSTLSVNFRPVSVTERPANSICISCIWWAEKGECFVTSVDTIHLLEQLLAAPARFTVEEKNRIRRNLEGFHPLTVSKAKAESEEFFKIIMAFPNPKPRNIEKDVKVFPWKVLGQALKKIISKYSASPSSTMPPAGGHGMMPVNAMGSGYPSLPPTPTEPMVPHQQYASHQPPQQHDLQSPRSVSGSSHSWVQYGTAGRTLSPVGGGIRDSPQSNLRMPLPHGYHDGRQQQPVTTVSAYTMPSTAPRWETGYPATADTGAAPAYQTHGVAAPASHAPTSLDPTDQSIGDRSLHIHRLGTGLAAAAIVQFTRPLSAFAISTHGSKPNQTKPNGRNLSMLHQQSVLGTQVFIFWWFAASFLVAPTLPWGTLATCAACDIRHLIWLGWVHHRSGDWDTIILHSGIDTMHNICVTRHIQTCQTPF